MLSNLTIFKNLLHDIILAHISININNDRPLLSNLHGL